MPPVLSVQKFFGGRSGNSHLRFAASEPAAGGVSHLVALDSIRGIAALSVILFHISWTNFTQHLSYVRNSYLMVDVFFVLSGFVIFHAYGQKLDTFLNVRRFMWLRFWRLYPLHFTFLIVFLVIECFKALAQWRFGLVAHHPAFVANNLYSFVGNLFLVQSLHLFDSLTFNYPSWSISVEFYTYIVFAILVYCAPGTKSALAAFAALCAAAIGTLVWLGPNASWVPNEFGILRCLAGFFLGALTCALYEKLRSLRIVKSNSAIIGWAALSTLAGCAIYLQLKTAGYSDLAIYPLSASLILLLSLSPTDGATRFLRSKPLVWLGAVSYSLYMVHAAVLWVIDQFIHFGLHPKEVVVPFFDTPVLAVNPTLGTVIMIVAIGLVLMVSQFTYKTIEEPFRIWSKDAWRPTPSGEPVGGIS